VRFLHELISRTQASRVAARERRPRASVPILDVRTAGARLCLVAFAMLLIAGPAHAAGGQLNLIPDPFRLFVMIVFFAVIIFPVNAILFQPMFRALDARDDEINGARKRAEKLEADASETLGRYQAAVRAEREAAELDRRRHLEAARDEQSQVTTAARAEAEREIEHARGELTRSLEEARATLRDGAQQLASEAAERILGRSVS